MSELDRSRHPVLSKQRQLYLDRVTADARPVLSCCMAPRGVHSHDVSVSGLRVMVTLDLLVFVWVPPAYSCSCVVWEQVHITGKYGVRYGASLRKQIKKIEITQHAKYTCGCKLLLSFHSTRFLCRVWHAFALNCKQVHAKDWPAENTAAICKCCKLWQSQHLVGVYRMVFCPSKQQTCDTKNRFDSRQETLLDRFGVEGGPFE